ncbi:MAG: response regulator transcription factor [Fluviicola sp.]
MEKILIVEDETSIRETLEEIFELSGYAVSSAKDGKEGFEKIINDTPDIVVCDVNMPEMNGFELLGAINERMKDDIVPPFLFLTAKVEPNDIRRGLGLGADDYILKPFDNNDLLSAVRLRLEKRKKILGNKQVVHLKSQQFTMKN